MKYIILETLFHWTCTAPLLYTPMDWFWAICEVSLIYLSLDYLRRRIRWKKI